jgi:hypothetical protein
MPRDDCVGHGAIYVPALSGRPAHEVALDVIELRRDTLARGIRVVGSSHNVGNAQQVAVVLVPGRRLVTDAYGIPGGHKDAAKLAFAARAPPPQPFLRRNLELTAGRGHLVERRLHRALLTVAALARTRHLA